MSLPYLYTVEQSTPTRAQVWSSCGSGKLGAGGAEWIVDVLAGHKGVSASELYLKFGYTKSVHVSYSVRTGTSLTC